jgi:hypothetical protein
MYLRTGRATKLFSLQLCLPSICSPMSLNAVALLEDCLQFYGPFRSPGVTSSMGVYVQDRTAMVGGREAQHANLRDVEQDVAAAEANRGHIGVAGDATQIEAEIEAIFAKPVMAGERVRGTVGSLSTRCGYPDGRTTEDCHRIAQLRASLARVAERDRRDSRIAELRLQARELRERGAADAPDPVAELFSWMSRGLLSVRDVGFGFPVAFALLIELVSAFGPIGIATYAAATRGPGIGGAMAPPASPVTLSVSVPRIADHSSGSVVDFIAEGTTPAPETAAIGCLEERIAPDATETFADFPIMRMTGKAIRVLRDRKANLPEASIGRVKAIRRLFSWAVDHDFLDEDPSRDVKRLTHVSEGHHSWTIEEVEQYEARHPLGSKAVSRLHYSCTLERDALMLCCLVRGM